jgi:hypothetical protein
MDRKAYPSDVTDEEWAFVAPYLMLMRENAPQRDYELREVFNGVRMLSALDVHGVPCHTICRLRKQSTNNHSVGLQPRCLKP